jgi:hypothetical protein
VVPALCAFSPTNLDGWSKEKEIANSNESNSNNNIIILLLLTLLQYTEQDGEPVRFYTLIQEVGGSILCRDTK